MIKFSFLSHIFITNNFLNDSTESINSKPLFLPNKLINKELKVKDLFKNITSIPKTLAKIKEKIKYISSIDMKGSMDNILITFDDINMDANRKILYLRSQYNNVFKYLSGESDIIFNFNELLFDLILIILIQIFHFLLYAGLIFLIFYLIKSIYLIKLQQELDKELDQFSIKKRKNELIKSNFLTILLKNIQGTGLKISLIGVSVVLLKILYDSHSSLEKFLFNYIKNLIS